MAKVFTPEEVRNHRIPGPEDFTNAANWLLNCVSSEDTSITEGILVFGSTTTGAANMRSDLDVLVSFTADGRSYSEIVRYYHRLFSQTEERYNVPIEPIIFSSQQLQSGRHTLDAMFVHHLASVDEERWLAGTNPINSVGDNNSDWLKIFRQYSIHKEKKFKKAIVNDSGDIDYRVLQRAYELPSALGRKCLGLLVETGRIEDEQFHTAPKARIIKAIAHLATSAVVEPLVYLVETNNSYSLVLNQTLYDEVSINEYENWLRRNYGTVLDAALDLTVEMLDFTESST